MKVPLPLKQLTIKYDMLTAKDRVMVIIVVGIVTLSITVYVSMLKVTVEPTLPNGTVIKMITNTSPPAVSLGQKIAQIKSSDPPLRDPFAKPPEFNIQKSSTAIGVPVLYNNIPTTIPGILPNRVSKNAMVNSIPERDFKLTGIVSGGNDQLAVIMSGSKSKAYGINDVFDAYEIKAINTDNVVLANNNTKFVLRLESVSQKEGTTSDQ